MDLYPKEISGLTKIHSEKSEDFLARMHRISQLRRDDLFDPKAEFNFSNKLGDVEQDPFIGYVGRNYFEASVKLCFIGRSNAESNKFQQQDREINSKLVAFRNASVSRRKTAYEDYRLCYERIIPEWKIGRYPKYLLEKLKMSFLDITYVNIVPFRYVKQPSQKVYSISFENFTSKFLDIVSPDIIIPLGKNLDNTIKRYCSFPEKVVSGITRTNGDSYIPPSSFEQMDDLAERLML